MKTLNIRGQVRLCRFYSPIQGKVEEKTPQNKVGKIPKPVFRNEKSTSKSNASISLFEQLASTSKVGLSKSNSTTDFEKKGGIVRAKSLKLPHTSSGSSLIDVTDSPADPLSHSVPAPNIIAKDESNKKLSEDNVDLIGLWEIDQEQKNVSRLSRNKEDTASRNSTRKELEHTKKGASTTGFIPYRIYLEGETSPGTKAFIDQIYAQVVSMDYQNTPNFMQFEEYKLVFRRYANLYFILGVDMDDDEFAMLEWIHLWMEVLDEYFGDATELDLMYNFYKCYIILDEMICSGNIIETSKDVILTRLAQLERLEK